MQQARPETSYHRQSSGNFEQSASSMAEQQQQFRQGQRQCEQHQLQQQHQSQWPQEEEDLLGVPLLTLQNHHQPLSFLQGECSNQQYPEVSCFAASPDFDRVAGATRLQIPTMPFGSLGQPGQLYPYMGGLPSCPMGTWSSLVSPTFAADLDEAFLDPSLHDSRMDCRGAKEQLEAERSLHCRGQTEQSSSFSQPQSSHHIQHEGDGNGSGFDLLHMQFDHELNRGSRTHFPDIVQYGQAAAYPYSTSFPQDSTFEGQGASGESSEPVWTPLLNPRYQQYGQSQWNASFETPSERPTRVELASQIPGPNRDELWSMDQIDTPLSAQPSAMTPSKRRKCIQKSSKSKSTPKGLLKAFIGSHHGRGPVPIKRLPPRTNRGPKKQYFCAREGCSTPAARLSDLDRHDLTQHQDTGERFSCGFCPPGTKKAEKEFKMLYNLQAHVSRTHKNFDRSSAAGKEYKDHHQIIPKVLYYRTSLGGEIVTRAGKRLAASLSGSVGAPSRRRIKSPGRMKSVNGTGDEDPQSSHPAFHRYFEQQSG